MIKQNSTAMKSILGGILMLTLSVTACNNAKEESKETPATEVKTATPPPAVTDSTDTMEKKTGNVAPGTDVKPATP